MEEYQIPVFIFRGVNTYDNVGCLLESFGIKIKMSEEASTTLEYEHDIATVALLPCGPLVPCYPLHR